MAITLTVTAKGQITLRKEVLNIWGCVRATSLTSIC